MHLSAALQQRRQMVADLVAARRKKVDEVTGGKEIMHLATEHLELTFSVRPLTVGRTKLDKYADELLAVLAEHRSAAGS